MARQWSVLRPVVGTPDPVAEVDRIAKELGIILNKHQREAAIDLMFEHLGYEELNKGS